MSVKKKPRSVRVNEGIQARTINADVIAVGRKAKASKIILGSDDQEKLLDAVLKLNEAVDSMQMQEIAKMAIKEEIEGLKSAVRSDQPKIDTVTRILQAIAAKFKMVGVVLADVVALKQPIQQIADLIKVPMKILGF